MSEHKYKREFEQIQKLKQEFEQMSQEERERSIRTVRRLEKRYHEGAGLQYPDGRLLTYRHLQILKEVHGLA